MRTTPEFESIKTRVYQCSPDEKAELLTLLAATKPVRKQDPVTDPDRPDSALFTLVRDVKQAKTKTPVSVTFKHLKPEERGRLQKVAAYFEDALSLHFPNIKTRQLRMGLKKFLVGVAVNKCIEDDVQPTMGRILDYLMPIEDLLESQFPGYMANGILETIIHQQLTKGRVTCSEPILSASKS